MTTISKKTNVPEDRLINIELSLPESIPVGAADVVVIISPHKERHPRASLASLAGSLADSKSFAGDAVALVRQWRDEW